MHAAGSSAQELTLALTGDVMLGRRVGERILQAGASYVWGDTLRYLSAADLRLVNLECVLTTRDERWRNGVYKAFYFRAPPQAGHALTSAAVDFAALANNHIGDYGMRAMLETLHLLDISHIAHAGAGSRLSEANAAARLRAKGFNVAVLAYADYPIGWAASSSQPGINYVEISCDPRVLRPIAQAIERARSGADLLVVSVHWGPNMRRRPPASFQSFARALIEAGADVFWGHSAHVVQGVELWRNGVILYDTGDFIDDYAVDSALRNDLSALFYVRYAQRGIHVQVLPVVIRDLRVRVAQGSDRSQFIRSFTELCGELGTSLSPVASSKLLQLATNAQQAAAAGLPRASL